MRPPLRACLTIVLAVAAACGGDGGSTASRGDYYAELERISQNAHIQERGLARELTQRLEGPASERLSAIEINVDQRTRLYEDVVDALTELEPLEELGAAHDAYVAAWRGELDLIRKVRDPGFRSVSLYLGALEASAFDNARATVRDVCEDLERIATAAGRQVDLACDGRPG
ncbi:MAG TPA: hypothetical protein VF108_07380 [Actinomycetota bacterium]